MKRAGWLRLSNPAHGTVAGWWLHTASGLEVRHGGHPTALWPYYVPQLRSQRRTFRLLAQAMDHVEAVHVQELEEAAAARAATGPVMVGWVELGATPADDVVHLAAAGEVLP